MTELIDELGPVGWLVIEFPGNRFNSEIPLTISAAALVWQTDGRAVPARPLAAPAASSSSTVASVQALLASVEADAAVMELEEGV
jgi:hypothetical protein